MPVQHTGIELGGRFSARVLFGILVLHPVVTVAPGYLRSGMRIGAARFFEKMYQGKDEKE